jgi:hypothetical protein
MSKIAPFWLRFVLGMALVIGESAFAAEQEIIVVDAPYELLDALGEYAELRLQEEQYQRQVDADMVPVLEIILSEFKLQAQRLHELTPALTPETRSRLDKIEHFIQLFTHERDYRDTVTRYRELTQQQQQLLEQK